MQFMLLVDEFELKYTSKEYAKHMMSALKENYEILTDWEGG